MLREAGAKEVHLRVSSPPYRWPCFYGMDTGSRGELLAANMEVDEIRGYLGVDTLSYLTLDRLIDAAGAPGAGFCTACLTGTYPVEIPPEAGKGVLEGGSIPAAESPVAAVPGTLMSSADLTLPSHEAARQEPLPLSPSLLEPVVPIEPGAPVVPPDVGGHVAGG
jgi:hypothetical protein